MDFALAVRLTCELMSSFSVFGLLTYLRIAPSSPFEASTSRGYKSQEWRDARHVEWFSNFGRALTLRHVLFVVTAWRWVGLGIPWAWAALDSRDPSGTQRRLLPKAT